MRERENEKKSLEVAKKEKKQKKIRLKEKN